MAATKPAGRAAFAKNCNCSKCSALGLRSKQSLFFKFCVQRIILIDILPTILQLKLPTMAAAGHLELVREVLANPRSVCVALWQYLASKDEFSRGSRVWLRTSMPWESSECVPLSHSLRLAAAAPSSLRSFSGVVAAISSEKDFIVEMTYGCGVCDSEKRIFLSGSSSSHVCCGFPMKHDLRRGLVLASVSFN